MDFRKQFESYAVKTEKALKKYLPQDVSSPELIKEAMAYSLLAGGKRIRPVMALAAADMISPGSSDDEKVLAYAAAVEMIHNYSLIHDDLPAMDNDTLRRGKPTNHVVYGEAMAILAGDALLTRAFELLTAAGEPTAAMAKAWGRLAVLAGTSGMIGGQVIDISSEGEKIELAELEKLQSMKTGALFQAPVCGIAALLSVPEEEEKLLESFAMHLGRAFQIKDDILDVKSSTEKMGKTIGKDARSEKATYVTLLGMETAEKKLHEAEQAASDTLDRLEEKGLGCAFYRALLELLSERDH